MAHVHVQAVSIWASLPLLQRLEAFLLPYSMYQQQQLQSAAAPSTAAATQCALTLSQSYQAPLY